MVKFQSLRFTITIATIAIIFLIAASITWLWPGNGWPVGVIVFLLLSVAFFIQGFPEIPANPLQRGIVKFLGDYVDKENGGVSIGPGRVFLPWLGLLFSYTLYDATIADLQFTIEERTPDNGTITMSPFLNYKIDPNHPYYFIVAGKMEKVIEKLIQWVDQRLREWVRSKQEGPLTWEEALGSNGLAMAVIIDKLFPGQLPTIPANVIHAIPGTVDIPIPLFVKYFTGLPALSTDKKAYPKEVAVQALLDNAKTNNRQAWEDLKAAVKNRLDFINTIKDGNCEFPILNLGIIIVRVGMGPIKADGQTAAAASAVAAEIQTAKLNTIKTNNFRDRVLTIKKINGDDEKNAVETVQLIDKLATKSIKEEQFAVRADTMDKLADVIRPIADRLAPKSGSSDLQAALTALNPLLDPIAKALADRIRNQN